MGGRAAFGSLLLALFTALLPLACCFSGRAASATARQADATAAGTPVRDHRFWLVTGGLFVCGFHVTFLVTHMPGVITACGLPSGLAGAWLAVAGGANIVGSLLAGGLIRRVAPAHLRHAGKHAREDLKRCPAQATGR